MGTVDVGASGSVCVGVVLGAAMDVNARELSVRNVNTEEMVTVWVVVGVGEEVRSLWVVPEDEEEGTMLGKLIMMLLDTAVAFAMEDPLALMLKEPEAEAEREPEAESENEKEREEFGALVMILPEALRVEVALPKEMLSVVLALLDADTELKYRIKKV